ncbi:hypothetical protein A8709_08575 [Paenibacillus pectinilyticus]|uniref:SGNH hydrolase-type esterase domain-containing protein n=1 Tax=Paenibacillus pectinilyticus TaxID=512399 RepID=A0A1C1A7Y3_9BACL|nr:GDSL-type esterase/lipase family protein [Paenibacillus pectinilyticus]OCT16712.1 hypothetical protein A8709_08575 [Paenibacillus pectinilyticus]
MVIVIIIIFLMITFLVWLIGYWGIASIPFERKARSGQVKVACVGDSLTYGLYVRNWYRNSYPKVLGRMLGKNFHVRNYGLSNRTGMETGNRPYQAEKRYRQSLSFAPDVVFIMFGTNDSKPNNWRGEKEFIRQYKKLIQSYREVPSSPAIYLLTPPTPYYVEGKTEGNMKFEIRKPEIMEIRDAVIEISQEWELKVIDINRKTDKHREWFTYDGIHTNVGGSEAIARTVYDEFKEEFQTKRQ